MRTLTCSMLWILACGPKGVDSDPAPDTTTDAPGTTTATDPTDSSTAATTPTTGECETDCVEQQFGFICIALAVGEGVAGDPFAATAKIVASMAYEPCLTDYYTTLHPEMRADGPADQGGKVFTTWKQRLCSEPVADRVECEVTQFEQTLIDVGPTPRHGLAVTYAIPDPAQLGGRKLLWGPAPLPQFAECSGDDEPTARLDGLTDIVGLDADGEVVWTIQSFGQPRGLVGLTGEDCVQVAVRPA